MAGIDDLIAAFTSQTNQALNEPSAPWQQELLETVNPEKVKRQNIARALAKASTAMATTPGNFLEGVSAAASQGADSYITGRDQAEQERQKVQQLLGMQKQKEQDRRLQLLLDAVGVQRNIAGDKRQEAQDARQAKESDARIAYYNQRGKGLSGDGLTQSQILTTKRTIRSELKTLENQLREDAKSDESLTPDAIQQRVDERRMELEDYYGLSLDTADAPGAAETPQVQSVAPGKTDQVVTKNPGITTPQATPGGGIKEGTTATNKATGERLIYRNGQWQPL